jgi:hypothetical protein
MYFELLIISSMRRHWNSNMSLTIDICAIAIALELPFLYV